MEGVSRKNILVVEDDPAMCQILSDKFSASGFHVLLAKDGEEGFAMACREHPDIIVLDILLPKMDGLTLLKTLGKDSWGENVPVVVYTNVSEAGGIAKTMKKNVYDFVPKAETDVNDLVQKVKERLGVGK